MGMDYGDGPDFDAIKKEREAAAGKLKKKEVVLTEDDCWVYQYILQKYKPTNTDDGQRQIYKNSLTNRYRMKKRVGEEWLSPRRSSIRIPIWDWDGEAYSQISKEDEPVTENN